MDSMSFLLILNGIYYRILLLRYFYLLAVVSNTIMNINWWVFGHVYFTAWGIYTGEELFIQMATLSLAF